MLAPMSKNKYQVVNIKVLPQFLDIQNLNQD